MHSIFCLCVMLGYCLVLWWTLSYYVQFSSIVFVIIYFQVKFDFNWMKYEILSSAKFVN